MKTKVFFPVRWVLAMLSLTIAVAFAGGASAHSFNESYVYFNVTDDSLDGRIEATTADLARVFAADVGDMTENEVIARQEEIFAFFEERLILNSEGARQTIDFNDVTFLEADFGNFAQLQFTVPDINATPETIEITYDFLFSDIDPDHRGFALIESNTRTGVANNESYISLFFEPGDGAKTLRLDGEPALEVAIEFLKQGVLHIWFGFDHVLFLFTLLVASVMVIQAGRWEPAGSLRESLIATVKIVTVFTVAHTITLGLATFDVIRLNVTLVEAIIAISIAVVALGNLFPKLHLTSWIVVFVFGLFHGFGFANVLAPLGLDPARKAVGLATFNVGVELGQLAIVLVVFPILFLLRKLAAYRVVVMQIGSVALIAIALFWFIERTYDVLGPVRANLIAWLS